MIDKIDCSYIRELLSEYVDGCLNPASSHLVSEHLLQCSKCKALRDDIEKIKLSLGTMEDESVPEALKEKVKSMAFEKRLLRNCMTAHRVINKPWLSIIAATFLIVLTIMIGVVINRSAGKRDVSSQSIVSELSRAENIYRRASMQLEKLVMNRMANMPPGMKFEFERNLKIIDDSIKKSRKYLEKQKQNPKAWEFLLAAYQKKVDFLELLLDTTEG